MKITKKTLLLLSLGLILSLSGCKAGDYKAFQKTLKNLEGKNVGLADIKVRQELFFDDSDNDKILQPKERLVKNSVPTTADDIEYLNQKAADLMQTFKVGTTGKPFIIESNQEVTENQKENWISLLNTHRIQDPSALLKEQRLDALVSISITFYYFRNSKNMFQKLNPVTNVKIVANVASGKRYYDRMGAEVKVEIFESNKEKPRKFKFYTTDTIKKESFLVPGYQFHRYPEISARIDSIWAQML